MLIYSTKTFWIMLIYATKTSLHFIAYTLMNVCIVKCISNLLKIHERRLKLHHKKLHNNHEQIRKHTNFWIIYEQLPKEVGFSLQLRWLHHSVLSVCRFWHFFANFATIKNLFQKSKCVHHPFTRRHLCAKFDVLRPSQSWFIFWRKNRSSTQTPSLFCHP